MRLNANISRALSYDEYYILKNEYSEVKNKYIVYSRISKVKFREIYLIFHLV